MLWLCFVLPELALESVFAADPEGGDAPTAPRAVFDGPAQRPRVLCANAAATAAGVRPGQTPALARALLPGLRLRARDPAAESSRLQVLGALAYGFSDQVVLESPDAVLLEIGASLRLFGGWARIEAALRSRLAALGHRHRLAAATTPDAARVLAARHDGALFDTAASTARALGHMPLALSRLPAPAMDLLARAGLRTLHEVFALPRAALLRRTGKATGEHLDRLLGAAADPRPLYRPPDRFERGIAFEYGVRSSDALLFPLWRLAQELAAFLAARDGGVARFALRFAHERDARDTPRSSVCEIGLRKSAREAQALFEAARGRLERFALPAPAHGLALIAEELPAFAPESRDLFDRGSRGALDHDALVERLRARLGDDAVQPIALAADHRPELAWSGSERPGAAPSVSPPRPLWLLPRPIPLRGRVARLLGTPERIESGWWDGGDVRRDYVVAELESGQRAWLFRDPCGGPWMLHGWFA